MSPKHEAAVFTPHKRCLPMMTINVDAIMNNVALMANYASKHGAALVPHVKSHMTPRIMEIQLEAGAWGLTAANVVQAESARQAGASRVLIANEVVGGADAHRLATLLNDGAEVICLVDDPRGAALLDACLHKTALGSHRLGVLIELGSTGGRAGARTGRQAIAAAQAVARTTHLSLRGVETYEGLVGHDGSPAAIRAVDRQLERLNQLFDHIDRAGLFASGQTAILSAGASRYANRTVQATQPYRHRQDVTVLMRPGTYVTYGNPGADAVFAAQIGERSAHLEPALTIWAEVMSQPEPGLAIVGLGKRNIGDRRAGIHLHTVASPGGGASSRVLGRTEIVGLDDQHAYIRYHDDRLAIGDVVAISVSHPWSLDQWPDLTAIDGAGTEIGHWATAYR